MTMSLATTCCIAGGGPAGMMLGFLLARAGVDVVVLEKHADFLRDFRGDTIHPSTLQVMHELGLLDEFLRRPHQKARQLGAKIGDFRLTIADFSHLPVAAKYIAMMPQWDFLDFLAGHAVVFKSFRLIRQAEVTGLLRDGERIVGVAATTPGGPLEIRAMLTVGADGRHSTVRAAAGLEVENLGAPIDVLWMRLSRRPGEGNTTMGRFDAGRVFVQIDRGDYWQCAWAIAKGGLEPIKAHGLPAFRAELAALSSDISHAVDELKTWDDVKLLTVTVDRLKQWHRPGLLCIGDAAHAMSPIGGIGINLAIQDAVATANILAAPLRAGRLRNADLAAVQRRRLWPTLLTQRLQVLAQDRIIGPLLARRGPLAPPRVLRLLAGWPFLRRIPARIIGMGFRPEHVRPAAAGE